MGFCRFLRNLFQKDTKKKKMKICCRRTRKVNEATLLDEDFEYLRRIGLAIVPTLARPKDRELAGDMLDRLKQMNPTPYPNVKRDINRFLRYYLRVLRWTQRNQPMSIYRQWYGAAIYGDSIEGAVGGANEPIRSGAGSSYACDETTCNNYRGDQTLLESEDDGKETRFWLQEAYSFLAMKSFPDGSTIVYTAVTKNPSAGWADGGLRLLRTDSARGPS